MKIRAKAIIRKLVALLVSRKVMKIKAKAVWVPKLVGAKKLYHKANLIHSRNGASDNLLNLGPILPEGIPDDCKFATQASFASEQYLYEVACATLKGEFPLIIKDGTYVLDGVFFSTEHDRFGAQLKANLSLQVRNKILENFSAKKTISNSKKIKKCVLLFSKWNHYGHWVPEHLLKLKVLLDVFGEDAKDICLVIEKDPPEWKLKVLRALGWGSNKIIEWDVNEAFIETLYIPNYPVPNYDGFRWLRDRLSSGLEVTPIRGKNRRIYLSRNKFGARMVTNEAELVNFLAQREFEVLYPELMSLEEQMLAFSEAEIVVGPHGSAFTNLIFADEAKVVELFGKFVPLGFYCYSKVMGHDYTPLFCESGDNKNDNLLVDILALDSAIGPLKS
jgi:hypothetical protein